MLDIESSDKVVDERVPLRIHERGLVQTTNLVVTITVASLSVLKWLLLGSEFLPIGGFIITGLGVGNGIYLARGGASVVAARLMILVLSVGLTYGSINTGGFDGPIVLLSPMIPVLAFLLIGSRAGWVSALAVSLILLLVLVLHLAGAIPPNPQTGHTLTLARFVALSATGVFVTWVIWAFAGNAAALGERNKVLANTDHLTGIANRRFSESFLKREILRAGRSGTDLSLIISDVDFFKHYNDVNGHQAGDECLQRVAGALRNAVQRPADIVGRFGGEEFIAVLPDTSPAGALAVAERMRQALQNEQIPYEPGKPEVVSMTFGVTSFPGREVESTSGMIKLADRALYQGKEQGRNTVVMNLPCGLNQQNLLTHPPATTRSQQAPVSRPERRERSQEK